MDSDAPTPHAAPAVEPGAAEPGVSSIDLIIELYKKDVDRTLIIEQLKKTPAQRGEDLQQFYDFLMEMRRGAAKAKSS